MDEPKGGNPPSEQQQEPFPYPEDPYDGHRPDTVPPAQTAVVPAGAAGGTAPPPPPPPEDEGDEEEEGMLRMSFLEHLEELRYRIIRALMGFGIAFLLCIVFANQLWRIVEAPAADALKKVGVADGKLAIIDPMEGFSIIWVWTP